MSLPPFMNINAIDSSKNKAGDQEEIYNYITCIGNNIDNIYNYLSEIKK